MIGTSIAHFQITAKLGQGGMGEVYRATDTKLGREVAIKVLPQGFAKDKERLARFEREAKTLATLNHPNIAGIYGLEQVGDSKALALELVEGEDLSERLRRGPLPVEDALKTSKQIAEALEAAHEKGIIHRDLKPGNVKLTEDGKVKVLDFGLAKALTDDSDATSASISEDSPTITDVFTRPGTILGTAAYMSPEQAKGNRVDKRTDIWAFGCILFECLSGRKAFQGEGVTEILASILKGEPDWNQLPQDIPSSIRRLLGKCLTKDYKRRTPDIAAARIDLEDTLANSIDSLNTLNHDASSLRPVHAPSHWPLTIGIATLLSIVMAFMGWMLKPVSVANLEPIRKFEMSLGLESGLELDTLQATTTFRLSPDGTTLAFLATTAHDDSNQLFIKSPTMLEPTPLTAVKNCSDFCFNPAGDWIAFRDRTDYQIKKAPVAGGPAVALSQAKEPVFGMNWGEGEWIAIGQAYGGIKGVSAIQAGKTIELTTLKDSERAHRWPYFLPGGHALLFSSGRTEGPVSQLKSQRISDGKAQSVAIAGHPIRGHHPHYLPGGHLVYMESDLEGSKLFGVGFDLSSLQPKGTPSILIDQIEAKWPDMVRLDVSNGTLAYLGKTDPVMTELEWIDRQGNSEHALHAAIRYNHRLSPNSRFIACFNHQDHLMIYDLERDSGFRLNSEIVGYDYPLWTPNGEALVFAGSPIPRKEVLDTLWQHIDGRQAKKLYTSDLSPFPIAWGPHGKQLIVFEGNDLKIMTAKGDQFPQWQEGKFTDFKMTSAAEEYGCFSPDGQWVVYTVEEKEQVDLYVSRIDQTGRGTKISVDPINRGVPIWTQSNEILFAAYSKGDHQLVSQIFTIKCETDGDTFSAGRPVPWPKGKAFYSYFDYDENTDRLIVAKQPEQQALPGRHQVVMLLQFNQFVTNQIPSWKN